MLGNGRERVEQEQWPEKQKDEGDVDENERVRALLRRVVT